MSSDRTYRTAEQRRRLRCLVPVRRVRTSLVFWYLCFGVLLRRRKKLKAIESKRRSICSVENLILIHKMDTNIQLRPNLRSAAMRVEALRCLKHPVRMQFGSAGIFLVEWGDGESAYFRELVCSLATVSRKRSMYSLAASLSAGVVSSFDSIGSCCSKAEK